MEHQNLIHAQGDHPIEDVTLPYQYLLLMYSISPYFNNSANSQQTWNRTPSVLQPFSHKAPKKKNSELYYRSNISKSIHSRILTDQLFTHSNAPFATPTLPYHAPAQLQSKSTERKDRAEAITQVPKSSTGVGGAVQDVFTAQPIKGK